MSYAGHTVTGRRIDEVSSIDQHVLDTLRTKAEVQKQLAEAGKPRIKAIDVPCPFCDVDAGSNCLAKRRHVNWHGGHHTERLQAAKAANEAYDAIKPR